MPVILPKGKLKFLIAEISVLNRARRQNRGKIDYAGVTVMKLAGFLLLLAGWIIVVDALALLTPAQATARTGFVCAGVSVEALGLVLVVRAHVIRGHRG